MKSARLPDGRTFQFSDDTPDEIIDHGVRAHVENTKKKADMEKQEQEQKHNQIIEGLQIISQLLHQLLQHTAHGHTEIGKILQEHTKMFSKPKKMKAIRDNQGKITGSEEY